jgi:MoxR-like ATPase
MQELYPRIVRHFIGRRHETRMIFAALLSGRHVMLEGPPGTSKSTILKSIVQEMGVPFVQVTGNNDLTSTKLVGHFDPAQALAKGYKPEHFQYGLLTEAMKEGAILYVEEFNRLPDDATNVFVTAMSERELALPRLGLVVAKPEFRVVAALNPYDDTGTMRMSRTLRDRFCSIKMDYQSRDEELDIVKRRTGSGHTGLVETAVEIARRTRTHKDIRLGASVRGAIDMVFIARQLLDFSDETEAERAHLALASALMALRDKIWLNETTSRAPDDIIQEVWQGLAEEWYTSEGEFWDLGDPNELKKTTRSQLTS